MKPWVKFGLPALLMVMGFGFDGAVCSAQDRGLCEAIIIDLDTGSVTSNFTFGAGSLLEVLPLPKAVSETLDTVADGFLTIEFGVTTQTTLDASMNCERCQGCTQGKLFNASLTLVSDSLFSNVNQVLVTSASNSFLIEQTQISNVKQIVRIREQRVFRQDLKVDLKPVLESVDEVTQQALEAAVEQVIGFRPGASATLQQFNIRASGSCSCTAIAMQLDCANNHPPQVNAPATLKVVRAVQGDLAVPARPTTFGVTVMDIDGNIDFQPTTGGVGIDIVHVQLLRGPVVASDGRFASYVFSFIPPAGNLEGFDIEMGAYDLCGAGDSQKTEIITVSTPSIGISLSAPAVSRALPPRFAGTGSVSVTDGDANDEVSWQVSSGNMILSPSFGKSFNSNILDAVEYSGTMSLPLNSTFDTAQRFFVEVTARDEGLGASGVPVKARAGVDAKLQNRPPQVQVDAPLQPVSGIPQVTFSAQDPDGDTISSCTVQSHTVHQAQAYQAASGSFAYLPNADAACSNGQPYFETFTAACTDAFGAEGAGQAAVQLFCPAQLADASIEVPEDSAHNFIGISIRNLGAVDESNLQYDATAPGKGTLHCDKNNCTYTPTPNANGRDGFLFRVRDARTGKSDESAVQITISGVNDPPFVANPLQDLSLMEDETSELQVDIGGVFDDIDLHTNTPPTPAEALSFSVGGAASFIDVIAVQGDLLSINLLENRHGVASITISAQDRAGVTAQDMFTVAVLPVPDPPQLKLPPNQIPPVELEEDDAPQTIDLLNYVEDPDVETDGDTLDFEVTNNTGPNVVVPTIDDHYLTLTLVPNASGDATLTIQASDGENPPLDFLLFVHVSEVNDCGSPFALVLTPQVSPGSTARIRLDVIDPDGSPTSGGQPGQEDFTLPYVFEYDVPSDTQPGTVNVEYMVFEAGCPPVTVKARYEVI